ncbi:hypothetical protein KGF56_004791 [Candida oxycetoniae]|uniref:Uncharacterized protein n=1 Tax=Candida oxycetoniae TaxID=497107 RepID=A0AAI9SST0_9ASCO|nr:uncharacterized protein KGF56_004791 [Candida oxycetoniae]KAI3402383.1 hypothetical protein KGF56_004791 [Candida oxycetoniae]
MNSNQDQHDTKSDIFPLDEHLQADYSVPDGSWEHNLEKKRLRSKTYGPNSQNQQTYGGPNSQNQQTFEPNSQNQQDYMKQAQVDNDDDNGDFPEHRESRTYEHHSSLFSSLPHLHFGSPKGYPGTDDVKNKEKDDGSSRAIPQGKKDLANSTTYNFADDDDEDHIDDFINLLG